MDIGSRKVLLSQCPLSVLEEGKGSERERGGGMEEQ